MNWTDYLAAAPEMTLLGLLCVVLVADSQEARMDANLEAIRNLRENLQSYGRDLDQLPYVLQLNKRDLPTAVSVEQMRDALCIDGEPVVEAVACDGRGVFTSLKEVIRLVMLDLKNRR